MANITRSCGHVETHSLYGKQSLRDWKVARLESEPCLKCRNGAAAVANQSAGLPALTGSEKQIAWAESIRAAALPRISSSVASIQNDALLFDEIQRAVVLDAAILIEEEWRTCTSASDWIDSRDLRFSEQYLLEEICRRFFQQDEEELDESTLWDVLSDARDRRAREAYQSRLALANVIAAQADPATASFTSGIIEMQVGDWRVSHMHSGTTVRCDATGESLSVTDSAIRDRFEAELDRRTAQENAAEATKLRDGIASGIAQVRKEKTSRGTRVVVVLRNNTEVMGMSRRGAFELQHSLLTDDEVSRLGQAAYEFAKGVR